jgi:carbon starvation protein
VSALWILFAALCSYAIAYRFYSRFIAYRVLRVDDRRATPAERLHNGIDFDVTDRRVLLRSPFRRHRRCRPARWPGAGRADGLPARHDLDRRRRDLRRRGPGHDGHVLLDAAQREEPRQMVREEIGIVGGVAALIAVFAIMIIILAVLALIVVNALAESPWGVSRSRSPSPSRCSWASTCGSCGRGGSSRRPRSASSCCCWRSWVAAGSTTPAWARRSRCPRSGWSSRW